MLRRLRALCNDQGGSYELIQFVMLLPVVILVLYGSFELWRLVSIKHSLDTGTYQAARYLSLYHDEYASAHARPQPVGDHRRRAERLIWESLMANPYVSKDTPLSAIVRYYNRVGQEIAPPVDFPCREIKDRLNDPRLVFTVRTWVMLPWQTSVLGLPFGNLTFTSAHTTFVDCGPWQQLLPTPVPTPTPGPGA